METDWRFQARCALRCLNHSIAADLFDASWYEMGFPPPVNVDDCTLEMADLFIYLFFFLGSFTSSDLSCANVGIVAK